MNARLVHTSYYIGLSVLLMGILFRVQHWPGHINIYGTGVLIELVFFIAAAIEIFTSYKAVTNVKLLWGIPCIILAIVMIACAIKVLLAPTLSLLLVIVAGRLYLRIGRAKFLRLKGKHDHISFDSIDV